jgi:hypothetical protein
MKRGVIALVFVSLVLISGISGCPSLKEGPGSAQFAPCFWVFKTNGDYSDLQFVQFFNENRTITDIESRGIPSLDAPSIEIHSPGSNPLLKLNQDYIGYGYGCYFPKYFSFSNISMSKWKNELEDCTNVLKEYEEKIVLKNCNDTKFFWKIQKYFEKSITLEEGVAQMIWEGKIRARAQTGGECAFTLSSEEQQEFEQQENNLGICTAQLGDKYNIETSVQNLVDNNPFTEFYLCNVKTIDEINSIINNNELSTKCEKKK